LPSRASGIPPVSFVEIALQSIKKKVVFWGELPEQVPIFRISMRRNGRSNDRE
jgi:hypothetical protein